MKKLARAVICAVALFACLAAQGRAEILYQDTFDNDTLGVNMGTGGGMSDKTLAGSPWVDDGNLSYPNGDSGHRAYVQSNNAFNMPNGFTLEVTWTGSVVPEFTSFGLSDADFVSNLDLTEDWLSDDSGTNEDYGYGIGLELGYAGNPGLKFNTGGATPTLSLLDSQTFTAAQHTLSLTVTPDDQFSYSIDGAPPTTGEIAPGVGTFDLTKNFRFAAYGQWESLTIEKVTIIAVPEPTSLTLLGAGLLGLICCIRRRRKR